jgi:O-antigen ligase
MSIAGTRDEPGTSTSVMGARGHTGIGARPRRWPALLVIALLVAAVLAPPVAASSDLTNLRLELLLWVVALPYLLYDWLLPSYRAARTEQDASAAWPGVFIRRLGLSAIDAGFVSLAAVMLVSVVHAAVMLGEAVSIRDGYDVVKLALYWIGFRTALLVAADRHWRGLILTCVLVAGMAAALTALVQYFDWLGLAEGAGRWWAEAHHLRGLERDGRAFGTVGNPNYFGALMAMLTVLALAVRGSPVRTAGRLQAWPATGMAVLGPLGVVLSGSRGALAMLVVGVAVAALVLLSVRPARGPAAAVTLAVAALVGSVALVELFPRGREDYITRVAGAFSPTGDSAVALRLDRWRNALGAGADAEGTSGGPTDAGAGGEVRNYLANGDLERVDGDHAAGFRTIPGTVYRVAPEAALSGGSGIVFGGSGDAVDQRAAVFQQRAFSRTGGAPLTASVWVQVPAPVRGEVSLYTNVLYADGERQDPYARVAADMTLIGVWQRLSITMQPDPARRVDFLGVYLLSDELAGEVYADGFQLVEGSAPVAVPGLAEAGAPAAPGLDAGRQLRRSPLFGGGPQKAAGGATLDNEYLLVAARYGLAGLVAYLFLWTAVAARAFRAARRGNRTAAALAGIVTGLLLFNLVAGSLYQLQLMALFWPLAGVILARGGDPEA